MISAPSIPKTSMASGARIEPSPIVPTQRLWTAPKTRPSTSSGTARWSSVNADTSTNVFPSPTIISRTKAGIGSGQSPMNAIGRPQRTMPTVKSKVSRARPMSATDATAPRTPPIPSAEVR